MNASRHPRHAKALAAYAIAFAALSGCLDGSQRADSEFQPLYLAYILIDQGMDAGPPPAIYEGRIAYPYCIVNPNNFTVVAGAGSEVYQVIEQPRHEMRLVENITRVRDELPEGFGFDAFAARHQILVNETASGGGSTNYSIHIWFHLWNEDRPIHRVDRWWNVTFVPYGQQTFFEEGEKCS